ncbi:DUF7260 family protein [Halobacterium noricense]|uniref:DUF7260 family protein n=1 Tax=Halobacterium noricense TaxID=223182 RepID=UPI001E354ACB|nr:hypothetical protein [Halobacterium noricense]UHH25242.1 hypothetical protein LT974_14840 [Halobacterium noricense]
MRAETYVKRAREQVHAERDATREKLAAVEAFTERVRALSPETATAAPTTGAHTTGETLQRSASGRTESRCRRVRAAFADTVRPHSVADIDGDESLLETIQEELSEPIAVALASTTDATFTADLRAAIVSTSRDRCDELRAAGRVLDRECEQVDAAAETITDVTDWLTAADGTALTELGFDALRERHATLTRHRDRCDRLAAERQSFLGKTTREDPRAAFDHRTLVEYTHRDAGPTYPVLAAAVRVDSVCADCQRAVRDHLTRCV